MSGVLFYSFFAFIMAIAAYAVIPRDKLKKYFLYGLLFGAIGDSVIYNALNVFGLVKYKGFGGLGIIDDYAITTPITWLFAFMLFFYFLPVRRWFLAVYIGAWSMLNYSVGIVMANYDLFEFVGYRGYWMYGFRKMEKREYNL